MTKFIFDWTVSLVPAYLADRSISPISIGSIKTNIVKIVQLLNIYKYIKWLRMCKQTKNMDIKC